MTPDDLDRLEALAVAATPGPWYVKGDDYGGDIYAAETNGVEAYIAVDHEGLLECVRTREDAVYIAALDPDVVRSLVADARLGAAWREAEAALPEGWKLAQLVRRQTIGRLTPPPERLWKATAQHGPRSDAEPWFSVSGPTPAAALLSLAEALRGRL